jgi:dephospho-CoA kinase
MIIGLTGTFASGKDTIADYLVKEKGFDSYQTGDVVREWVKKEGLELTRDNQREMANKLRSQFGASFLVEEAIKKTHKENKAITGIRQPNEAEFFTKTDGAYLIAVDAPIEARFDRIVKRKREGDPITLDELKTKENKEMTNSGDNPNCQNISYCMKMAKFKIDNSGTFEELYKKVDDVLDQIENKE